MKLDWVYPAGNSDLSHVVIEVSDRADGSNPRLLGNVSYPTNTLTIQGLRAVLINGTERKPLISLAMKVIGRTSLKARLE
ncbi:hypothetical protein [Acinetobacter baumannii]|uniref:hypothetical protein n=1 Tax=Acinetobacter baumannii TaxID=470 RepID=UPI001E617B5B|nr:hypothetical protein [Acinetobacter baumannii]